VTALAALPGDVPAGDALLSDQAYAVIRDLIVTLDLAPGSVVSEQDLMVRLGMGRTPIREALRMLAQDRLVDIYPRRGMFVTGIDVRDLAALSEVRTVIEPAAARLATERITDEDRAELDALLAELHGHGIGSRPLIDLDRRIHGFVYRCARSAYLADACQRHYTHALRIWFLALDRLENLDDAVREHVAILEAVREGDPDRAAQVMLGHIEGFEQSIRQML